MMAFSMFCAIPCPCPCWDDDARPVGNLVSACGRRLDRRFVGATRIPDPSNRPAALFRRGAFMRFSLSDYGVYAHGRIYGRDRRCEILAESRRAPSDLERSAYRFVCRDRLRFADSDAVFVLCFGKNGCKHLRADSDPNHVQNSCRFLRDGASADIGKPVCGRLSKRH